MWGGNITTGLSAVKVGGIVGGAVLALLLMLVCGCAGGVMVVYLLRQRKRMKMKGFPYTQTYVENKSIFSGYYSGPNVFKAIFAAYIVYPSQCYTNYMCLSFVQDYRHAAQPVPL